MAERGAARIDFAAVAQAALQAAERLVPQWLPGGRRRGREWVCGSVRGDEGTSCSVNLATGAWSDFATGERGGDLVALYAARFGVSMGDAARELQRELGMAAPADAPQRGHGSSGRQRAAPAGGAADRGGTAWLPLHPVPADAPPYREHWGHYARGVPRRHWEYRDAAGLLVGVVCRFERSDGGKDVQPLSYCQASDGRRQWRYHAFAEPRPLYGMDRLHAATGQGGAVPVAVVVEGEKCADALQAVLSPAVPVLTWPGGANAVRKADWASLRGRVQRVICWADADAKVDKASGKRLPLEQQPGMRAMRAVEQALAEVGVTVRHVDIGTPGERPDGWDCADAIAEGWTVDDVRGFLRRLLPEGAPADAPQDAAPAQAGRGGKGASTPGTADAGQQGQPQDWRALLIWRNAHQILPCVPNVIEVLARHDDWVGVIGFDEFSQRVVKRLPAPWEQRGAPMASDEWSDVDDTRAAAWIAHHERFVPTSAAVAEAVNVVARMNAFHPVRDWLATLRWDGTPRLDHWMVDLLSAPDTEYVRRVSRYFLVGMVMRVLQPGCKFDYCLVLEGAQGRRKSTALRVLGGPWFSDIELDLANKDSMSNIRGKWLHEFGEMGSIARSEATRQKSFLSRQVDEFRPSYGRREIRCPRQSAFAGTTNEWAWNKDPTGGRRFWPVEINGEIDTDGLQSVREQLFAEAYVAATAGEQYWPTGQEQRELFDPEQLAREAPDAYVELLGSWLADVNFAKSEFTLAAAITEGLKIEARSITRDIQTRVGIALAKLGCERVERRHAASRFVYRPPRRKVASSGPDANAEAVQEVPF